MVCHVFTTIHELEERDFKAVYYQNGGTPWAVIQDRFWNQSDFRENLRKRTARRLQDLRAGSVLPMYVCTRKKDVGGR